MLVPIQNAACVSGQGLGAIDVSQFTWQDWAVIAGGGLLVYMLGSRKSSRPRRSRGSRKLATFSGSVDFKTIAILGALGIGGYYLYQASQSPTASALLSPGTSLGTSIMNLFGGSSSGTAAGSAYSS
jgi:hypothetical protein